MTRGRSAIKTFSSYDRGYWVSYFRNVKEPTLFDMDDTGLVGRQFFADEFRARESMALWIKKGKNLPSKNARIKADENL